MLVIGLTGKTGAGKTTVAKFLKENGCFIIDGDIVARQISEKGSECLEALCEAFGNDILDENGALIRSALAKKAFKDRESTNLLNSITHPFIKKDFISQLRKAERKGYKAAIIDAAALLESDCKDLCEKIIVVTAPENIRAERVAKRDKISKEQITLRIKAQREDEYYLSKADVVFRNYEPYCSSEEEFSKLLGIIS